MITDFFRKLIPENQLKRFIDVTERNGVKEESHVHQYCADRYGLQTLAV